jgi:hypothetical protein
MSYIIEKFIKNTGQYKYAYVALIINNDIYANPGIIFAESLKKIGCLSDIVALVDNNISSETVKLLRNFFNKIITIDTIKINNKSLIQNIILSKIYVYNLVEYDKIFLIDVDTIFFTNPDNLFLQSNDIDDTKNLYMVDSSNYGFILIYPSVNIYKKCKKIISENKNELENEIKPFKYVLNKIYSKSNIKKLDYKITYDSYSLTDCIQYRRDKPFLMSSELTIEQRQRLDHFKVWFSYLTNILNKYPEIRQYKCVSETIQVSKYFLSSLSRFVIELVKSNKKSTNKLTNITNIYGTNDYNNLDYYHLDITKEYSTRYIKYDIDTYDIKSFLKYINNKLLKKYDNYTTVKELITKLQSVDLNLLYLFLNNYIKMFPNIFATMELNPSLDMKPQSIPDLKNNLIYRQEYKLTNILVKNIVFDIYQNFTYNQRIQEIIKKITNPEYIVIISVYEMFGPIIDFDTNSDLDLFIFYEQGTKIRLSSIFFNPNTINQYNLKSGMLNLFGYNDKMTNLNKNQLITMVYLQTLKKYIYSIYSGDEINNLGLVVHNYDKITLIDNNKHQISKIKSLNSNKIFFITIIFACSSQYKNILKKSNIDVKKIYNPVNYWEFDGIKILI